MISNVQNRSVNCLACPWCLEPSAARERAGIRAWFEQKPDPINPKRRVFQYKGGYWEAKAKGSWEEHSLVDVYDIRPVEDKDQEAAEAARKAMSMNDHSQQE